ncbi:MAG: tryptophan synthase subunit alpha [Micrococcaceae bacterium]
MSKTKTAIETACASRKAAFIGYLSGGYHSKSECIEAAIALSENGADVIELGIPYSDPVMDGPVIQQANDSVLSRGFHTSEMFDITHEITQNVDATVVMMTYWNPVFKFGVEKFAQQLAQAGGAGLITPDLIPDEAAEWITASNAEHLDRIFLVSESVEPQRIPYIQSASRGFVYATSVMGVTGERAKISENTEDLVEKTKAAGSNPVCVGLGISRAEQVDTISNYADGVIVGSALIKALNNNGVEGVAALTAELSAPLKD